jgi:hypothetical protein
MSEVFEILCLENVWTFLSLCHPLAQELATSEDEEPPYNFRIFLKTTYFFSNWSQREILCHCYLCWFICCYCFNLYKFIQYTSESLQASMTEPKILTVHSCLKRHLKIWNKLKLFMVSNSLPNEISHKRDCSVLWLLQVFYFFHRLIIYVTLVSFVSAKIK